MRDSHLEAMRRISWIIIIALFIYIFAMSLFEPSRAELMSRSDGRSVYMEILWVNIYALIPCTILFMLAISSGIILFTLRKTLPEDMKKAMMCLTDFISAAAMWVMTDSYILSFVTADTRIVALISYLSFTTMFAFLFEFIIYITGKKMSLYILCDIFYIMAVIQILCFCFGFLPIKNLILPVHFLCIIGTVIVTRYGIDELKQNSESEVKRIIIGFVVLIVFGISSMIAYYINPKIKYSLFYAIGISIFCIELIIAALNVIRKQIEHDANESAYRRLAYTDVMTGLMNKAAYIEEEKKPLTESCVYLMMDINNLKRINDTYGHRTGDDVIISAADYIKKYFDKALCYRFGGDEFIVICKEYTLDKVRQLIADMRNEMEHDNKARQVPVELAVGYSCSGSSDTVEDMFQRADRSMYEDKIKQKMGRTD